MHRGDVLTRVNNQDTAYISSHDAQRLINNSGLELKVEVERLVRKIKFKREYFEHPQSLKILDSYFPSTVRRVVK